MEFIFKNQEQILKITTKLLAINQETNLRESYQLIIFKILIANNRQVKIKQLKNLKLKV